MNKKGFLVVIVMLLAFPSAFAANATCTGSDGLISYWPFSEGTGTSTEDSIGSNDGTISGASWVAGKVGNGLSFDGSNDGVDLTNIETDSWSEVSISAWFKTDSTAAQRIVAKDQVGVPGNFILWYSGTDWEFIVRDDSANVWRRAEFASTAPNDDNWHHIVGVVDQADDLVKLYIDNVAVANATFLASTLDDSDNENLAAGADSDVGSYAHVFDGEIDEVVIYNTSLSDAEIEELFNRGTSNISVCASLTCVDNDGDGFGNSCAKGPDCNDNDANIHPPEDGATYNASKEFCPGTYNLPNGFTMGTLLVEMGSGSFTID